MSDLVTLKTQLWMGNEGPSPEKIQPVTNDFESRVICKPKGGFWTSTYSPEIGSDWYQWVVGIGSVRDPETSSYYLLQPKEAKVLVVDDLESLRSLFTAYSISAMPWLEEIPLLKEQLKGLRFDPRSLDFEEIAKTYDAIHLTHEGMAATKSYLHRDDAPGFVRELGMLALRAWDCETVLWLRWKFGGITQITRECFTKEWR